MGLGPRKPKDKVSRLGNVGHPVTAAQWEIFLENVSKTANVTKSCEVAGFERIAFYNRKKVDPEFVARFEEAYKRGYDVLEEECQRRAFAGYEKPVFQGGRRVGSVTEFSDGLAMFLMKGRKPGVFIDRSSVDVTTTNAGKDDCSSLTNEQLDAKLAELARVVR
jgi:hypothetical protein